MEKRNPNEALRYTQKALELIKNKKYPSLMALITSNLAHIYRDRLEFDISLKYGKDALKIYRKIKNLEGEAASLNNIGSIHHEMGDFQEALKYYKQALEIAEKAGFKKQITTTQQNIEKTKSKIQK